MGVPRFLYDLYTAVCKYGFYIAHAEEICGEYQIHLKSGNMHWIVFLSLDNPELSDIRDATPHGSRIWHGVTVV